MDVGSLLGRKKGPGSEELSRSSALFRRKLEDLAAEGAAKAAPALMLRLMASLMCFTISRFSSAVLQKIDGINVQGVLIIIHCSYYLFSHRSTKLTVRSYLDLLQVSLQLARFIRRKFRPLHTDTEGAWGLENQK